ncbi:MULTISPECIES: accessory factor UbiK family protein [Acetobacter]|uniref:Accessory factor UbiK family protein n=1 Tax=Acetobacter thailandicus TaxID=1502842 RepID=A0ABT3QE82_9PROT|nr:MULTISPECIES: accessory factor UbiK family protein [Acetobacter]MBS0960647.1 accessory factor UbiK family protein [Acetobacter thailandicus]MBS0980262.1 accessory factor UbiK family protein [Acetobacter thailandicus]MBS0986164.1 accessory factor UbiK family protein [Acetobacter thailandicus]MBS1004065.1 accessory factor UbiK family protein [Acetobacter thailandicus]MCX2563597.1 accessory factor UbiK family protein [Acetobacter thailandicus]
MTDRPRFFDDLTGIAGGAFSAFTGAREELNAIIRNRVSEILASLHVVRREEFDIVREMATQTRISLDAAERRIADLETHIENLKRS